ncbi:HK97 family phage prohead protease [Micromonospora sp. NPDC050417]|uniref:HK97 family phage prohead protease n=1 Tax=Micromonospora sp. NPDC050417 TaxID=3364280 RepID=UPI0037BC6894
MTDLLRTFTPDLEVRSAAKGGDGRTIYGIAVPWAAPQRIDANLTEQFARGAFNHQIRAANRIWFSREHIALGGALIGSPTLMRDDAAGLYVELRASKTPLGDETLELVRDGALSHLSVAFRERQNRRLGHIVERVTADLREVAVTVQGAYGDLAAAAGVRSAAEQAAPAESGFECERLCCRAAGLEEARLVLAGLPALP